MSDLVKRMRLLLDAVNRIEEQQKRIEELQAENQLLRDDRASRFAQTERRYRELQRKYEALVEGINTLPTWFAHNGEPVKRHPNATIQGEFVKVNELRALLETDDE